MDSSIDRLTTNRWDLTTNAAQTPAQLAEEWTFKNELAALQIDPSDSEELPSSKLSSLFDPYASYRLPVAQSKEAPECTLPPVADIAGETIEIPEGRAGGQPQLAAVNNNPGNLKFVHQAGATLGTGGFARFETPEAGYRALVDQIRLDAGRGKTLAQYITKYAPPPENDTGLYIAQACRSLGIDANAPLASLDPAKVAAFQARKESGTIVG